MSEMVNLLCCLTPNPGKFDRVGDAFYGPCPVRPIPCMCHGSLLTIQITYLYEQLKSLLADLAQTVAVQHPDCLRYVVWEQVDTNNDRNLFILEQYAFYLPGAATSFLNPSLTVIRPIQVGVPRCP